ncbi:MAG TPA: hypothetical protein DCS07_10310 [Bdellovibrionales bacterium]|nr:MAG: hypothetical protein A2Z97_16045 [Bdellovibrionales bacterium GWB1_52_6]OFZ03062.1 MAG: hypothetical protein A2X97_09465 [Bdellovibrionales bacterium GWA1_52_35]OFZ43302.1 MAG: hypothetical protein A2070_07715 [Bdellovibrionales bacterium GWC1_52_8]OGK08135.1 MAG: hypothetical protein A2W80_03120 [Candidatus Riflebacteria bacterium GWC2_50_8]HAR43003.1 hypothetical protein [Bdellovibrionales bacterium]
MISYEWNAAIKGVIEGFTEFLPISSTGHLVLVRDFFPLTGDPARVQELDNLFDVVIQLPAVLAIVILFWRRLWKSTAGILSSDEARNFWISVIAAFIPAAIIGFAVKDKLDLLMQPQIVALALVIGGVVILAIERWGFSGAIARAEDVPLAKALSIGFFQCLSIIPGTSRSGATIIGGRVFGLNRTAAAEFSFFLALPTMIGAFTLKIVKEFHHIVWATDGPILLIGSVTSFVSAWIVVSLFIRFIQKYSLSVFGWYRIALGTLILVFSASNGS